MSQIFNKHAFPFSVFTGVMHVFQEWPVFYNFLFLLTDKTLFSKFSKLKTQLQASFSVWRLKNLHWQLSLKTWGHVAARFFLVSCLKPLVDSFFLGFLLAVTHTFPFCCSLPSQPNWHYTSVKAIVCDSKALESHANRKIHYGICL